MIAAWLTILACSGTSDDGNDGPADSVDTDGVTTTGETGDTSTVPTEAWFTASIEPPPLTGVGLAAQFTLDADRPCRVELTLDSGAHRRVIAPPDSASSHAWPVLGLRAEQDYDVTVVATDDDGGTATVQLSWTTFELPAAFPQFEVLAHDAARSEPGILLLNADLQGGPRYLVVLDDELQVVWYLETERHYEDIGLTERGTLVGVATPSGTELDWLGNEILSMTTMPEEPWDVQVAYTLHHEIETQPGGDGYFAMASRDLFEPIYPDDYDLTSASPQMIGDHGFAEIDANGVGTRIRWLGPILDTRRIGYDSLNNFFGVKDWGHGNGFHYNPGDDSVIVSLRHQDAVVKVDTNGDLVWILGRPTGFRPQFLSKVLQAVGSPFDYPYHQHAPEVLDNGDLLLFDNGNYHRLPYDGPGVDVNVSRVVAYRIDEGLGRVEQVWEYKDTMVGELFADATGDADELPNGNVLAVFGRVIEVGGVDNQDRGLGDKAAHIIEFDPAAPDPPVLHLHVFSHLEDNDKGWAVYRGEHLPGFYVWEQ